MTLLKYYIYEFLIMCFYLVPLQKQILLREISLEHTIIHWDTSDQRIFFIQITANSHVYAEVKCFRPTVFKKFTKKIVIRLFFQVFSRKLCNYAFPTYFLSWPSFFFQYISHQKKFRNNFEHYYGWKKILEHLHGYNLFVFFFVFG